MNDVSVVGVFCDDIRQETAGTVTIVGVYPDNITVPLIPGVLPKLCGYVRMHLRPDFKPGRIVTRMLSPSGKELSASEAGVQLVDNMLKTARAEGKPYAGLVASFAVVQLQITEIGRLRLVVTIGEDEYIAAALNVRVAPGQNKDQRTTQISN